MAMVIDNKFEFGQIVYLKTDTDQIPRIVTTLSVSSNGIIYELSTGERVSRHYDFEMSAEKDIVLTFNSPVGG